MVDDFSDRSYLKKQLDEYIVTLPAKVRVLRAGQREGLIRGRLMGAHAAQVQIFGRTAQYRLGAR